MKTNGDDPISANAPMQFQMTEKDELLPICGPGLTKREYFAAMALQGHFDPLDCEDRIAEICVKMADALIKALNEEGDR